MKTVEEVMDIVYEYAKDVEDIAYSEAVFAHVGKSRYADSDKLLADIRTAIEELAADATQWQLYKSRKDAVIAAGMGKKAMRDSAAGAAPVPRMTGAALASQEPVAEVLLVDGEKVIDASMAFFDSVELGTKLYLAAGAAPVPSELVLTFNFGTLVKVVFQDRVLYEVDLSPKPYFQVCWAHGWAGGYESEEEAREECLSLCGHGRSIREIKPGDDGYKNPHQPQLTEKRFLLAAAGAAPVQQEPEPIQVCRLMKKEEGIWVAASEFYAGHPDQKWVKLVSINPGYWSIQRRVTGKQIADGLAKALAGTPPALEVTECQWSLEDDDSGTWRSSCGELWSFIDGGPNENRVTYCHHCGGKVSNAAAGAALKEPS